MLLKSAKAKGFTLIEVLVALVIVSVFATVLLQLFRQAMDYEQRTIQRSQSLLAFEIIAPIYYKLKFGIDRREKIFRSIGPKEQEILGAKFTKMGFLVDNVKLKADVYFVMNRVQKLR